jgi:hypothetical protein
MKELVEISETKDSQLFVVRVPCRFQGLEIANNPSARVRVQIAAPGRAQNTFYNLAHWTLALQWLHCSIPPWFRQLFPTPRSAAQEKTK